MAEAAAAGLLTAPRPVAPIGSTGTPRALGGSMRSLSKQLVAGVLLLAGARVAGAQSAGVIVPPPAPAPPPARTTPVAAKPSPTARRDSIVAAQRLDIQAWVDSAAGRLAAGAAASSSPLTPPPAPAPDSARATPPAKTPTDSTPRLRSRRPTPMRRPAPAPTRPTSPG